MKPLGMHKTRTRVAGHQDCSTCHPDTTKGGRAREKRDPISWEEIKRIQQIAREAEHQRRTQMIARATRGGWRRTER
jgi:hypothetical protein